jgi:hypothetical protein
MTCWNARRLLSEYLDGTLPPAEQSALEAHLRTCEPCPGVLEQDRSLRTTLASLPQPAAPPELRDSLLVQASQQQQAVRETHGSHARYLWNRWKSRLDEFMRPLTIPATGGFLSSVFLFGALGFLIGTRSAAVGYEVPVVYAEQPDANLVPVELRLPVVLTMSLDGNGRITDYAVQDGSDSFVGDTSRLQPNNISLPEFSNILALSRPVTRDVSISFTPIVYRP